MKLVITYGCVSMGKHLYRTGDSFELPDDEAEKLMERADEQVIALVGKKRHLPKTAQQNPRQMKNQAWNCQRLMPPRLSKNEHVQRDGSFGHFLFHQS